MVATKPTPDGGMMMLSDFRFGARSLRRQPLQNTVVISVIGLGVALNVAIFSVLSALLFRPPTVKDPGSLIYAYEVPSGRRPTPVSGSALAQLASGRGTVFADLSGTWTIDLLLTTRDRSQAERGELVQPGYFELLGVPIEMGRPLDTEDHLAGTGFRPAVISASLWKRRFSGQQDVIGTHFRLAEEGEIDFVVVGVARSGFDGIAAPWAPNDFWIPAAIAERELLEMPPGLHMRFVGLARLSEEATLADAKAFGESVSALAFSSGNSSFMLSPASLVRLPGDPGAEVVPAKLATALLVVALIVLAVVVTNIMGILEARNILRRTDTALRLALGAGTSRIVRQYLAEGLILSVAGTAAGLGLAVLLLHGFRVSASAAGFPIGASIDLRVIGLTGAIVVTLGLLLGLGPLWHQRRTRAFSSGLGDSRSGRQRFGRRLRYVVLIPQVALSLALLVSAFSYLGNHLRLEQRGRGYEPMGVVVVDARLPLTATHNAETRATRTRAFYDNLLLNLGSLPGIRASIVSSWLPLHVPAESALSEVRSNAPGALARPRPAFALSVSPGYFDTLRVRVVMGRDFQADDSETSPRVAILSASLANSLFRGSDPLGQTVSVKTSGFNPRQEILQVIGVVEDTRPVLQSDVDTPTFYRSIGQSDRPGGFVVLARGGEIRSVSRAVGLAVQRADGSALALNSRALDEMIDVVLYPRRLAGTVLVGSTVIAVLLSGVGVFSVVSFSVVQRFGELGIRRALGATDRQIKGLVVRECLVALIPAVLSGVLLGNGALRIASHRFEAVPGPEAATIVLAVGFMFGATLLACVLPARRAAAVEPADVLRRL